MNVDNAAPGIFQLPSGYAAVVNQDGTINGPQNPAAIGSVVSLYVTGLGPLSPTPADGSVVGLPLPTLANKVSVLFHTSKDLSTPLVGGEVFYAGAAPLEVAGLYQINVLIQVRLLSPPISTPIPPARVQIVAELPGDRFVVTSIDGPPISIQGVDVLNR
jgi:uncharacterized protein (TIGR03437 family)